MNKLVVWKVGEKHFLPLPKIKGTVLAISDSEIFVEADGVLCVFRYSQDFHPIFTLSDVVQVSCNSETVLLLLETQEIWGYSQNPHNFIIPRPSSPDRLCKIEGLSQISSMSIGSTHAAALNTNGSLFTWGLCPQETFKDLAKIHSTPYLVSQASIFTVEQVLCGSCFTVIRTQGGYIFIFGVLPKGSKCNLREFSRVSPYTVPELEAEYCTEICASENFLAALSNCCVFIIDSCLSPLKISVRQKEITKIYANGEYLLGIDANRMYLWKFGEGRSCELENWDMKVVIFNGICKVVSGVQENVAILNGGVGEFVEDEHEAVVEKVKKLIKKEQLKQKNVVLIVLERFKRYLRDLFAMFSGRRVGSVLMGITDLKKVFSNRINWAFGMVRKNRRNEGVKVGVRCGIVIIRVLIGEAEKRAKLRMFCKWRFGRGVNVSKVLGRVLGRVYLQRTKKFFCDIFEYWEVIRMNSLYRAVVLLVKQNELINYLNQSKTLKKLKLAPRRRPSNLALPQKTFALTLTSPNHTFKTSDFPFQSYLDQSPRQQNRKILTKDPKIISRPRASSKPLTIDKQRVSEKPKQLKKGIQYIEEFKNRQLKTKILKLSKENEIEKSPLSPSRIFGLHKLSTFVLILSNKIKSRYIETFPLLKYQKMSLFGLANEEVEILPVAVPEIWKIKVFSLGINKISAMSKRHLKHSVLSSLLSK